MYLEAERRCEHAPCWTASREDSVLEHSQEGRRLHVRDPDLVLVLGQLSVKHGVEDGAAHGQDILTEDRGQTCKSWGQAWPANANRLREVHLVSRDSLRPTSRTHHKMDIGHHLIVEHDGIPAETGHPGQLQTGQRGQRSGVNLQTDRSRMVGKRPCQERLLLLLLARFCCWYRWMDALLDEDELRIVVGKSSAAILVQSESQPGHGRSGTGRRG